MRQHLQVLDAGRDDELTDWYGEALNEGMNKGHYKMLQADEVHTLLATAPEGRWRSAMPIVQTCAE